MPNIKASPTSVKENGLDGDKLHLRDPETWALFQFAKSMFVPISKYCYSGQDLEILITTVLLSYVFFCGVLPFLLLIKLMLFMLLFVRLVTSLVAPAGWTRGM